MSTASIPAHPLWIDGADTPSATGAELESIDPTDGSVHYRLARGDHRDVDRAVAAADRARSGPWARFTGHERARALRRLAALIETRADGLARLESRDNGKVLREVAAQVAALPETIEYVSGWADKLHGEALRLDGSPYFVTTRREPVGVVAAIVPWNSPLPLTVLKVAPALAAGCTVVVKPSEHTSATALEFARMCSEAGFPDGVVNVVTGLGDEAGSPLVRDPRVAKISFTGSTQTGVRITQESAPNVARLMLELGGKSANIILADADLEAATTGAVAGIFAASGQTCIAGSRLLVHRSVHDEMVARVAERAQRIRLGDPALAETEMGPVAFAAQMDKVLGHLEGAAADGARIVAGGGRVLDGALAQGYFIAPSVLADVDNTMRVAREEIFGPVLSVIAFDDVEEALAIANDSPYGLAAGVWSQDVRRALRLSTRLDAGTIWINTYRASSHVVPFGGFKHSGIGYQGGREGLDAFLRTKAVWIETEGAARDPFRMG